MTVNNLQNGDAPRSMNPRLDQLGRGNGLESEHYNEILEHRDL